MNSSLAYQDGPRMEKIGGKLVAMSPRPVVNHNHIIFNLALIFGNYLRDKRCVPFADGTDLYLTEDERYVPDFMVVCDPDKIKTNGVYGAPDLVVEVLSPSSARNDRTHKKDVYARCGVREYWIVSPAEKTVEVYRNNGSELVLHDIYVQYAGWMIDQMTDEERSEMVTHFQCSLYDDLDISLEDIFLRTN